MRDYAIDLLRDSVGSEEAAAPDAVASAKAPPLNPFALGIPVLLIGVMLTFLFPPVGVSLLLLGLVICIVGVTMAVFRSVWARWRPGDGVQ